MRRKNAALMMMIMVIATGFSGCLGGEDSVTVTCGNDTELVDGTCVTKLNDVEFTLQGKDMSYIGVGGSIDGIVNPDLTVQPGDRVTITLQMGEANLHDISVEGYDVTTEQLTDMGSEDSITFVADTQGEFAYYCSIPGHRAGGMVGNLIVGSAQSGTTIIENIGPAKDVDVENIARDPYDIPGPTGRNASTTVHIYLEAVEVTAELEVGTTFTYWTYNATVPGPMFRARVNDTVVVHFSNQAESLMHHNVDFHAVTGQGGGAAATTTAPGEETTFSFLAMHSGLYVYHCATPDIPTHISKGMYGMIFIEPEVPLPAVDKEIYFMQGDLYTKWRPGTEGHQEMDVDALFDERPTYVVFNGKFATFTGEDTIKANVGETMRIYFGVGGPNTISSFHVIGEIFDRVYNLGGTESAPLESIQTVVVAPGGAVIVDISFEVPANYILVDHALTRAFYKGAIGIIEVAGEENTTVYDENGE